MEARTIYDNPPKITVTIPELKNICPEWKDWESVNRFNPLLTDVLLLVITDEEFLSCYVFLYNVFKSLVNELGHVYFGEIGNSSKKVKIALVKSFSGAAQNVVKNAVDVFKPKAVFSVGFCAGLRKDKLQLGDVVISRKLVTYGDTIVVDDELQWNGCRLDVSAKIGRLIVSAAHGWQPPLNDLEACDVKVHCDAEILSGAKLVNSPQECAKLLHQFPEAIAIEPEGQGPCYLLSVICYLLSVICYLLSVICYLLSVICYLLSVICYLLYSISSIVRPNNYFSLQLCFATFSHIVIHKTKTKELLKLNNEPICGKNGV